MPLKTIEEIKEDLTELSSYSPRALREILYHVGYLFAQEVDRLNDVVSGLEHEVKEKE